MSMLNPELRRNLWLELSLPRLIAMPVILFMLFALGWIWGEKAAVANAAMIIGWCILVLWGTRLACDSIVSEVQARTWDGQRLSGIGPAAMTTGKLLGGTVYAWYGAAICLVAVIASGGQEGDALAPIRLVVTGLFAQSVALWFGLVQLRLQSGVRRLQVTFAQVLAILASAQFLPLLAGFDLEVPWYGIVFRSDTFTLFATGLFAVWSWIGCYRLMRAELQYRSRPLVWLAYLLFLVAFFNGFTDQLMDTATSVVSERVFVRGAVSFYVLIAATWLAAFLEPKSIVRLRRLFERLRTGQHARALDDLPAWFAGLPVVLAVGAVAIVTIPAEQDRFGAQLLSSFLFLLRDALLIYYVALAPRARRGHIAALVYLIVLYGVIPAILAGAGSHVLIPAFVPVGGGDQLLGLLGPLAQVIGFGFLLATRFTRPRDEGQ